jgi:hypothetical protein
MFYSVKMTERQRSTNNYIFVREKVYRKNKKRDLYVIVIKKVVTVQVAITFQVVILKMENVLVHFIATSRV